MRNCGNPEAIPSPILAFRLGDKVIVDEGGNDTIPLKTYVRHRQKRTAGRFSTEVLEQKGNDESTEEATSSHRKLVGAMANN